ncbi:ribosomal protein L14-domain-containing protein [Peziza echinospora]|nr:ribosomal protein L14-domain-containing protein [Peziza echinospora]
MAVKVRVEEDLYTPINISMVVSLGTRTGGEHPRVDQGAAVEIPASTPIPQLVTRPTTTTTRHTAPANDTRPSENNPNTLEMSNEVQTSHWRLVEVGRVVLLNDGPEAGKLAAIVEIIDHKRVLVDGPKSGVTRQSIALSHVTLTPILVSEIPRGGRSGVIAKYWEKAGVDAKWSASAWAQKIASRERRRELTDFDRFKVMVLKKQRRYEVRRSHAKIRKTAA